MIKFCETEEELYEVAKIHTDNRIHVYQGILEERYLNSLRIDMAFLKWKKFKEKEDRKLLIYVAENEVIGFSAVKFWAECVDCGRLEHLHVKNTMQHRGIGRMLITATADFLLSIGIHSMQICVVKGNYRAENLYRFLGAEFMDEFIDVFDNQYMVPSKRYIWNSLNQLTHTAITGVAKYNDNQLLDILHDKFVLFGAGKYGDVFVERFPETKPIAILDNDKQKWGTKKQGVTIVQPYTCENIIISSCYYSQIEQQLKEMKCKNVVGFYPWHSYIGE